MEIKNEDQYCQFIKMLENDNKITCEESDALVSYVCGIFDALSGFCIEEIDLE